MAIFIKMRLLNNPSLHHVQWKRYNNDAILFVHTN